ncbi:MAG: PrsW family glutamic-type intramembrane protease [Candidatus Thermoplasmatota archaeon]
MPERIRPKHLLLSFGLGAFSGFLAVVGEIGFIGNTLPLALADMTLWTLLLASIVAPLVEESVKPVGLFVAYQEDRPNLTIQQWALLGLMAGLGFALLEDILYVLSIVPFGADAALTLLGMRLLFPVHMICTTLTGIGYGLWVKTRQPMHFILFIAIAMCIHGLFNFSASVVG